MWNDRMTCGLRPWCGIDSDVDGHLNVKYWANVKISSLHLMDENVKVSLSLECVNLFFKLLIPVYYLICYNILPIC